jgi:hypothetical protein
MSFWTTAILRRRLLGLAVWGVGVVTLVEAIDSYACRGTPVPPCSRSIHVTQFVTQSVVHAGAGNPIAVPVSVLPFCEWNTALALGSSVPVCAQPSAATLTLTAECTSITTGAAVTIGPLSVPVLVPSASGPQPMPTPDANSPVGGNVIFSIPADVLAAGDQYRCALSGVYDVTFSAPGATGLGVIRGRGNTQFSIVEPSSADPGVPRLDLQLITLGYGGFNITRSGDQPVNTYFVANNDPSNIAVFTVSIW